MKGQREYESRLARMAEEDPSNISSWITARRLSKDSFMRVYYLRQMVLAIRENKTFLAYAQGIFYVFDIGNESLEEELLKEISNKYPLRSLLLRILIQLRK
jgi:hypothetical protein